MEIKLLSQIYGEKTFLIDDEDYDKIKSLTWHLHYFKNNDSFYVSRSFNKNGKVKTQSLHRFIMGNPEGMCVDHINHNTLDNRKSNLRICTNAENKRNSLKYKNTKISKYKGVYLSNKKVKKFRADIRVNKKMIFLGLFGTEIEAALAYNDAAIKYFGEFASLNKIE